MDVGDPRVAEPLDRADDETRSKQVAPAKSVIKAASVRASDVQAAPVEWLWPERVPLRAVSVLAGDPGLGKSLLTVELAARVTRGDLGVAGDVLLLTAEDSFVHVVRPRLEAAGAVLERVWFGQAKRDGCDTPLLLPDDVVALRDLVSEGPVRLVVIDPLSAHLAASVNSWKDQEIRRAVAPLHGLAEEAGAAVVVVAHLNKGQGADPLHRLGGSIGLPAAARSVLLLARDPSDPDGEEGSRRVLAQAKSNFGPMAPGLSFEIESVMLSGFGIETARIRETGISGYGPADLLTTDEPVRGNKLAQAIEFLHTELASGPRPVDELKRAAEQRGISDSTLERAKKKLGIESAKIAFGEGWEWRLPDADPVEREESQGW